MKHPTSSSAFVVPFASPVRGVPLSLAVRPAPVQPRANSEPLSVPPAAPSIPDPAAALTVFPSPSSPHIYFSPSAAASISQDLVVPLSLHDVSVSFFYALAFYVGFGEKYRWGTALYYAVLDALPKALPRSVAKVVAAVVHVPPFAAAGLLGYHGVLAALDDGFAISSGVLLAINAFLFDLGRPNQAAIRTAQTPEGVAKDRAAWEAFLEFATKRLEVREGARCHFTEIEEEFRRSSPAAASKEKVSDGMIKRMIARYAGPAVKKSKNDFYKNVGLKGERSKSMF